MTHTTISLQKETLDILEQIRQNDPNFNLSGFLNNKIKEGLGNEEILLSKEFLNDQIKIMKSEINTMLRKIDMYHTKIQDIEVKEMLSKEEEQIRLKKDKEKLEYQRKMINDFFKEETGREITLEEFEEYKEKIENNEVDNIFHYINIKGLKTIEVKE